MAENDENDQGNQPDIRKLREAANRSDEHRTRADAAERALAFTKAGFDTDHKLVQNLMSGYTGELTKDAVKSYMDELQVSQLLTPTPAPAGGETQQQQGEAQGQQQQGGEQTQGGQAEGTEGGAPSEAQLRQQAAGSGEIPGGIPGDDPRMTGLNKAFDLMQQGASREDASTAFFAEIFGAAQAGDQRVLTVNKSGERIEV